MKITLRSNQRGVSLVELVVVVAILLVVAALALPTMSNVIANMRLRAGMSSLAGLMQNCRMIAVKQNKNMSVHLNNGISAGPIACIADASLGDPSATPPYTCQPGDPVVELGAPMTYVSGSPSGTGAPSTISTTSTGLNFTPYSTGTLDVSFNPRGMVCQYDSGNCFGNAPHGFVYYFHDSRPLGNNAWAAVSVSPAGRVKTWYWNGGSWGD